VAAVSAALLALTAIPFPAAQAGTPTVNGLFYGDGDYNNYLLWAVAPEGRGTLYYSMPGDTLYLAVVVDADGLSVWQGRADELADLVTDRDVITPHPGEMARLLDKEVEAIVADPRSSVVEAAQRFGCTVVLKGAPTLVAAREGPLLVTTVGGSALAAGGSGDVLTGLIGAYLAAGLPAAPAAASALFLSGLAAELGSHPAGHAADEIPDRLPVVREEIGRLPGYGGGSVIFASASPEKPGGGLRS
jgi:hypothetical protein